LRSDEGAGGAVIGHPDRYLARTDDGGFEIVVAGGSTVRVDPCDAGWSVDGERGFEGWVLRRSGEEAPGFVLGDAGGRSEAGRTMPLVGTGREAGLRFLLLDDGRLFRIVRSDPRRGGFELLGWETPGAYLTALPESNGWALRATAAAAGLEDLRTICLLFAAEILDAEQPLGTEER